jgi:hypothetical protein
MAYLPHVDEIRDLRARAVRADRAYHLVVEAEALSRSISALAPVVVEGEFEPPGVEFVGRATQVFPELQVVESIDGSPMVRVLQQVRTIAQLLAPYANQSGTLAERLHHLQHHQAEALQEPEFAELREQINQKNAEKLDSQRIVQALSGRVVALRSVLTVFEPMLEAFRTDDDPEVVEAWLSHSITGLEAVTELAAPGWTILDAEGSAEERVRRAKEKLAQLHGLLASSEDDLERAQQHITEVEQWIMERTG